MKDADPSQVADYMLKLRAQLRLSLLAPSKVQTTDSEENQIVRKLHEQIY